MSDFWENVADNGLCQNGEKSEVYKYFYDLFSNKPLDFRAGIITDERIMTRNVIEHFIKEAHADTLTRISDELGMKKYDERNVYWFCYNDGGYGEFRLRIESDNYPGLGQISFLAELLNAYQDYKKDSESRKKRVLYFEGGDSDADFSYDGMAMKEYIKSAIITRSEPVKQNDLRTPELGEDEFYIVHSESFKEKDLLFNLKMENVKTLEDLFHGNMYMSNFEKSPYYHDTLIRLIPDYEIIEKFSKEIVGFILPENLKAVEVMLANVRQVLLENLDSIIFGGSQSTSSLLTFRRAVLLLYEQDYNNDVIPSDAMEEIEQHFPHFRFVNEFIERRFSKEGNSELEINDEAELIHPENGYAALSKEIINCLFREKNAEIQMRKEKRQSLSTAQLVMTLISEFIDEKVKGKKQKTIEDLESELKALEATGLIDEDNLRGNGLTIENPQ